MDEFYFSALLGGTNKGSHADGSYLIEIDRLLRPGGYFVLSGPPVNFLGKERDYDALQELIAEKMCYTTVATPDKTAIWQKLNQRSQKSTFLPLKQLLNVLPVSAAR